MTRIIFLKELQHLLVNKIFVFSSILVILLLMLNIFSFRENYKSEIDEYNRINAERISSLEYPADFMSDIMSVLTGKRKKNFYDVIHTEQKIVVKPSALSFISSNHNLLPNGMIITYFREKFPEHFKTSNQFFPTYVSMDFVNIMLYCISLLCLILSYNAFSGEKERGTLKLILVNNVSRSHVIMGKYLSLLVCISTPILAGIILNIIFAETFPVVQLTGLDYIKIGVFFIVSLLFITLNIFIGFIISVLTHKSSVSLIFALLTWIILLIFIPSVSWIIGKEVVSVPKKSNVNKVVELRIQEEVKNNKGKYTLSWNSQWDEGPPNNLVYKRVNAFNRMDEIYNEVQRDYRNKLFYQVDKSINFSKISPYSVFRFCSEKISDNGFSKTQRFYNSVINYANLFREYVKNIDANDKDSYHLISSDNISKMFFSQKELNVNKIPKYTPKKSSFSTLLKSIMADFIILFLWCTFLFAGVFICFVRYDFR